MKPVILYHSQTGFTRQYAEWMAGELSCPCFSFEERKRIDFSRYDTIIFGSWCHAGKLKKYKWFQEMLPAWRGKRKAVFAVGASPAGAQQIEQFLKTLTVPGEEMAAFYLPGGLRYERMGAASRIMMKAFSAMVNGKKQKTLEEEQMAQMVSRSYDISDRNLIRPVLKYVRGN
ncbi:MAG: flavodoxin [Lachnospiraceae bacterium]|nr:flavodoxin [Lachnospiraceae bacterium]